jgi:glycosidase
MWVFDGLREVETVKVMGKKEGTLIQIGIAAVLLILSGCIDQVRIPTATSTRVVSPTVTHSVDAPGQSWLFQGPIYETHPYYHGETFKDIAERIPDISDLGVKTLYLMPIWEQPEGFPTEKAVHSRNIYRVPDFYKIDPVYGTPGDLKRLIATAHEYNLKVLLDLIPNNTPMGSEIWENGWIHTTSHSGLQNKAQRGQVTLEYGFARGGEYVSYGCIEREDNLLCEVAGLILEDEVRLLHFPRQGWGFAPDYTNLELIDYFSTLAAYYVMEFDIDGWRVDAPGDNWNPEIITEDHSITNLLKSIKKAITDIKSDAVLICETPHVSRRSDPPPVLDGICDASYSHHFYLGLIYENPTEIDSHLLIDVLSKEQIWHDATRIRFLETHDSPRIADIAPELNEPLFVLIATVPGIPMIQAGQEIGVQTRYGPDLDIHWQLGDTELRDFYTDVIQIRNSRNALRFGTIENVWQSGDRVGAYLRSYQDEQVIVVINFRKPAATSTLSLPMDSGITLLDHLSGETFTIDDPGRFNISVPGYGSRILVETHAE